MIKKLTIWWLKRLQRKMGLYRMYKVTMKQRSDIEPIVFVYDYFDEDYENNEYEFVNHEAGQVLRVSKDDFSYYKTEPYITYEN